MISPALKLEANPVARRFFKIVAPIGFLFCLVPYAHWGLGIQVAVCFLLVAASNFSRGWLAHAIGESEYLAVLMRAAQRSSLRNALRFVYSFSLFAGLAGFLMLVLGDGLDTPATWIGAGFLTYVAATTLYSTLFIVRLFRRASLEGATDEGAHGRTGAIP
jgi:hypothetical protein